MVMMMMVREVQRVEQEHKAEFRSVPRKKGGGGGSRTAVRCLCDCKFALRP
jgi:hypothetical protein